MNKKNQTISFRLTDDEYSKLKDLSVKNECTVSDFLFKIVEKEIYFRNKTEVKYKWDYGRKDNNKT